MMIFFLLYNARCKDIGRILCIFPHMNSTRQHAPKNPLEVDLSEQDVLHTIELEPGQLFLARVTRFGDSGASIIKYDCKIFPPRVFCEWN